MMFWQRFLRLFSRDIAMDLGTANTLLYTPSGGIVVNEPSVVALDAVTGQVLAVGTEAKRAMGRTPRRIRCVRPMKSGVIADFDVTSHMVIHFIRKAMGRLRLARPSMVIGVPSSITQVEKKAVIDAALGAGAVDVVLIEEPMAAAIGAGLPIHEPIGSLVADIGGGTSEVAVISLSAIAVSRSVRVAGDVMNECVQRALRNEYRLEVGENTAEQIKMAVGAALPDPALAPLPVSGKDLSIGAPRTMSIDPAVVCEALREPVESIVGAVMNTLEQTPPELAADIYDTGFLLAGGGALLRGLPELLESRTGLQVRLDADPLTTVLRGVATSMRERRDRCRDVFIN